MLSGLPFFWLVALALAGLALDRLLGEPPARWHPLVAFGRWAAALERRCNADALQPGAALGVRLHGVAALALVAGGPTLLLALAVVVAHRMSQSGSAPAAITLALLHGVPLVLALGGRSLHEHVLPIGQALQAGDLPQARVLAGRIVSRDLHDADEPAVARAAVESALENGNDAVFGAWLWFLLAGGPGALAYRLVNTLDAMWGYRTPRFLRFGWAAARLDDALNWLPARATALTYAALGAAQGRGGLALRCWRGQAPAWDSPNAGPVMASGAGALGLRLGGPACYHGRIEDRPPLGEGRAPGAPDVARALALVQHTARLWALLLLGGALLHGVVHGVVA